MSQFFLLDNSQMKWRANGNYGCHCACVDNSKIMRDAELMIIVFNKHKEQKHTQTPHNINERP